MADSASFRDCGLALQAVYEIAVTMGELEVKVLAMMNSKISKKSNEIHWTIESMKSYWKEARSHRTSWKSLIRR